jgi:hypothetical protein
MISLRELAHESAADANGETGSLLVVDDNEINRDLLSRYLARLGHRVQTAPDGRRALEMIDTGVFDSDHHIKKSIGCPPYRSFFVNLYPLLRAFFGLFRHIAPL